MESTSPQPSEQAVGDAGWPPYLPPTTQASGVGARRPSRARRLVTGKIQMISSDDDWRKTVRRNKLLGMWAAEKLGIRGREAEAYSDGLAVGTLDPERSDVLPSTLRA
jgi:ATPase inhibitor subunit zeta